MNLRKRMISPIGLLFLMLVFFSISDTTYAFFNLGWKNESDTESKPSPVGNASAKVKPKTDKDQGSSGKDAIPAKTEQLEKKNPATEDPKSEMEDTGVEKGEGKIQVEQETDIMEAALSLLDEAQKYWSQGDLEDAVDLLDQAYSILLETNGDPQIARQKDDIRLLIAKKILAIYTYRHVATPGMRGEIPIVVNADVEKEIRCFQTIEREFFIESYQRSFRYRPIIAKELKKAGIPEELAWLPLVESGYKISALSRARALGLWQFIPSTGYKYGLNRDDWIDERMDVEKSTRAAIAYLKDLHEMFGDWLTVLSAYNCGEARVLRTISAQRINYLDRFWDLYHQLPYETARYVPRFLATLLIIKDPKKYGMEDLDSVAVREALPPYELVKTGKSMRLQDIAQKIEVNEDQLEILNAELRHLATPDREYELKVPNEKAEQLLKVVNDIPQWEQPKPPPIAKKGSIITHRVRSGESLASIARKFKTTQSAIRSYNDLSGNKVHTGQCLKIPRGYRYAKANKESNQNTNSKKYKVKKGDTLYSIASKNNTSMDKICELNKLKKNTKVKIGQTIVLE